MKFKSSENKSAFTLVELLVVIAIIGILTTIAVVALNNARAKARDAKRVADIKQVQTALELFFNDNNRYPTAAEFNSGSLFSTSSLGTTTYMAAIPNTPGPADGNCDAQYDQYIYSASDNGATYNLSFCLGGATGSLAAGGSCATVAGFSSEFCPCNENTICGLHCFYDGQKYNTVTIGTQCWFQNNLNAGTMILGSVTQGDADGGNIEKYCYNDDEAYCSTDGALYAWHTAMALPETCDNHDGTAPCVVGTPHQGICPSGWHIPSDSEWHTLELGFATSTCDPARDGQGCVPAGDELRVGGSSGFNGLLAGVRTSVFGWRNSYGYHWSSALQSNTRSVLRNIPLDSYVARSYGDKINEISVRCLKD
ncbi:MAG: FISUMP domain-containing protein [Candidatus Omnitrophota bacterium]|jgi:general secretion pathway protein G